MSTKRKLSKSVFSIILIGIFSKLMGFCRELLIAANYGSNDTTDAYFIAMTFSSIVTALIIDTLNTTFIPVISQIQTNHGKKKENIYTNDILNSVVLFSIILIILNYYFSPYIIKILASGFTGDKFILANQLNIIGFPVILFMGMTVIFKSYLQSKGQFSIPAATGLILNFVYIVFLLFFYNDFGIKGLMVTTVISALAQVVFLLPLAYKHGFRFKITLNFNDKYVKKTLYLIGPVVLGSMVYQINSFIDRTLASQLESGSISALNYAQILNGLFISIFIMAITTVIYPTLSKEAVIVNNGKFKQTIGASTRLVLLISIPATALIIILAHPIVQTFLERGSFDIKATEKTSEALIYYSIGLVGIGLRELLSKVFYSIGDTRTPMVNAIIGVILNIVLNFILIKYLGLRGLALATSISSLITTMLLLFSLSKNEKLLNIGELTYFIIKIFSATIIMGITVYYICNYSYHLITPTTVVRSIYLLIYFLVGFITFFVSCALLKIEETKIIIRQIIDKKNR